MPEPYKRSRSLRRLQVKVSGGQTKTHYRERKPKIGRCNVTGQTLKGIPRDRPNKYINNFKTMRARYNKRGVSPLIATVLLISFAVALGSVVINWGRNLDIAMGDVCTGISMKIRNVEDSQVCYSGQGQNTYIKFIIDNDGSANIDGLGIWITGEKGTKLLDFNDFSITKGELLEVKDKSIIYDSNAYGTIKQIQFFPKVKGTDSIELCARNSVKVSKIKAC